MKFLSPVVLAVVGVAVASPAFAEIVSGEVGLTYGFVDAESLDESLTGVTLHSSVDYAISPAFGVQAGATFNRYDYDDGAVDASLEMTSFDLHGYYRLGATRLGVFVGRQDLGDLSIAGVGSMDADVQMTTYGLEADYNAGAFTVGGHVGMAEVEDLDDIDTRFVGFDASYAVNERFAVLTDFDWTEAETQGDALTVTSVRLGGEYYVQPRLALTAYIGRVSGEVDGLGSEDATIYGVGVKYAFGEGGANRSRSFGSLNLPF